MTAALPDYEPRFAEAIEFFWATRNRQATEQRARGVTDAGTRGAVTGGQHLNALAALIRQVFADAGMDTPVASSVLPGYYRIAKNWDVVITYKHRVVAIIELKSHVGSFGNNQNNRIEEMVGQSLDIWRAARENLLGDIRPWFGYLMLLEDHQDSRRCPSGRGAPILPTDPIFQDTNYLDRYQIAFARLRLEGDMNAVCLLFSDPATASVEYPEPTMSFNAFAAAIHGRVTEVLGLLGT
ncbi:MAG TPA: PaeR7I family type II restriction endonuclease [Actinomycetota bacterium]|nr:PaeR7I family type II restriction endonuclease [Actinomycetota bacterium]